MNITLSAAQAGRLALPAGTVVEAQIKADPYAVWAARTNSEHGESGLLTLEPDQIKGLIPFAPGLTRVVSQAREGRSQLLRHWIKSGGPEWRDVYFVDPEGIYRAAPEDVPVRVLTNYATDAQIDRLMVRVSSGGILVIDHAEQVQCDNLTDSEATSPLALGQFLARLGLVAKRRGGMVIAAIQCRRSDAPGIRVYSPEGR